MITSPVESTTLESFYAEGPLLHSCSDLPITDPQRRCTGSCMRFSYTPFGPVPESQGGFPASHWQTSRERGNFANDVIKANWGVAVSLFEDGFIEISPKRQI